MSTPIRILLVDDDPVRRAGLRCLLARQPGIAVVGVAADSAGAIQQARSLLPAVILLDLVLPNPSSLTSIAMLVRRLPGVRILVLTDLVNNTTTLQVLCAGAAGCLLKTSPVVELARAIRAVHAGELVPPDPAPAGSGAPAPSRRLSQREEQTLQLLACGLSPGEIANQLRIERNTVHTYLNRLFSKLRLADRDQAARYALATGLLNQAEVAGSPTLLDSGVTAARMRRGLP